MEGTLKYNIDPLNLYTDDQIKEVLQMIGFWYIAENNPKGLELNVINLLIYKIYLNYYYYYSSSIKFKLDH